MPYAPLFEHGTKRRVSMFVDGPIYDRLKAVAKHRQYSLSAMVRSAMIAKLSQCEHDYGLDSAALLAEMRKNGVALEDDSPDDWTADDGDHADEATP